MSPRQTQHAKTLVWIFFLFSVGLSFWVLVGCSVYGMVSR